MLFILVMDVLSHLVSKAAANGLLQPISSRVTHHQISLYVDDVVIFLRPALDEMDIIIKLLQLFGDGSGLKTNIQKSNVFPIQCTEPDRVLIQEHLPCEVLDFPCKYLGLPLSTKKLTRAQIQPFIDRIANRLPGWKANLLTKAGWKVLVQFVLTSMLVYLAMAVDLPPWAIKAVDKIKRVFFGVAGKMRRAVIVWWLGVRLVIPLNWVALVSLISRAWDGLFVCDGCGCRKQSKINHGLPSRFKFISAHKLSSPLQL